MFYYVYPGGSVVLKPTLGLTKTRFFSNLDLKSFVIQIVMLCNKNYSLIKFLFWSNLLNILVLEKVLVVVGSKKSQHALINRKKRNKENIHTDIELLLNWYL